MGMGVTSGQSPRSEQKYWCDSVTLEERPVLEG